MTSNSQVGGGPIFGRPGTWGVGREMLPKNDDGRQTTATTGEPEPVLYSARGLTPELDAGGRKC